MQSKQEMILEPKTQITTYDDRTEIHFEDENGDADFTIYKVFPGIELVFSSIHTDKCKLAPIRDGNFYEISHCREGRLEMMIDGDYFYLTPGDLSIAKRKYLELDAEFPIRHYHGITIEIDAEFVPKAFYTMLKDTPVVPSVVAEKLCGDNNYYIARSESYVEHIFSELYSVPEKIRNGYFKVKVLELLLVLSCIEPENNPEGSRGMSAQQVQLAKEVCGYLQSRMDERPTITELASQFHVSPTKLKDVFKCVYGVPIYSYMKIQKMQAAALQLVNTERSILDIAYDYGYNSASKFSAAFREIMGELPQEYRRAHGKSGEDTNERKVNKQDATRCK